ncbi:MAG: circadian clock protein KaiB [Desulfobacteraceae bacterium]|nr:circadian clock protein KaiB [Desulfobacteraceae bacterium]
MLELRLYIIGKTPRAIKALEDLKALLYDQYKDKYTLEVVDVLENPGLAEHDKILATPTVIKRLPVPIRKAIGDLVDKEKVLLGLDLVRHE